MMPQSPGFPTTPERHVFVYGSLREGGRNDIRRLAPEPRFVGKGTVLGRLYRVDWYPGLLLGGEDATPVVGEVYAIPPGLEAVLDRIEEIEAHPDSEYFKREVEVDVEGRRLACLVYEIHPGRVRACARIDGGDWSAFHIS